MGVLTLGMRTVFERLGQECIVAPPVTQKTIALGAKHSPELACFPFKATLGTMIESLEMGADTIVMATSGGNCRLGFYWPAQQVILRNLGYEFLMLPINYDNPISFLAEFKRFGGGKSWREVLAAFIFGLRKLLAFEEVERLSMRIRARERVKGATTRAYRSAIGVVDRVPEPRDLPRARVEAVGIMNAVELVAGAAPPRVKVLGEAFMLMEPNLNFQLQVTLGEMGVEVDRTYWLGQRIKRAVRLDRAGRRHAERVKREAYPYMRYPDLCTGSESLGEAIVAAKEGFDGAVLLMPFACMPEVLAESLCSRVTSEHGIPVLTVAIDEHSDDGGLRTRLEAFTDLLKMNSDAFARRTH
jgi:predicted nucleotide-binding protein (sugar kinase/HSP70/actin superfamily)